MLFLTTPFLVVHRIDEWSPLFTTFGEQFANRLSEADMKNRRMTLAHQGLFPNMTSPGKKKNLGLPLVKVLVEENHKPKQKCVSRPYYLSLFPKIVQNSGEKVGR